MASGDEYERMQMTEGAPPENDTINDASFKELLEQTTQPLDTPDNKATATKRKKLKCRKVRIM